MSIPIVPLGSALEQLGVDAQRQLRGVGRLGDDVHHLARALGRGVGEVKRLAVEPILVGDVVQRGGHVVDRDDVGVAELGADEREPARQVVPRHLDRGEEVVRPVDLVHLAGL